MIDINIKGIYRIMLSNSYEREVITQDHHSAVIEVSLDEYSTRRMIILKREGTIWQQEGQTYIGAEDRDSDGHPFINEIYRRNIR